MYSLIVILIPGLLIYFLAAHLLAAVELAVRRKRQRQTFHASLSQDGVGYDEVKFYPATFWYLLHKWLKFTGTIFAPIGAIGGLLLNGFISGGGTLIEAVLQTARILAIAFILLGLPIAVVRHFFGQRIGLTLLAYAEYGISKDGLLYCPFNQWHLVPWKSITGIRPMKTYMGTVPGFQIDVKQVSILPGWYKKYVWGKTEKYPLILLYLLPGASDLKQEIEKRLQS